MGRGQICKGFIWLLTQLRTGFIKFVPAVGVKKTIGPYNVSAFLRNMAQHTANKCLRLQSKSATLMLFGMGIGDRYLFSIVTNNTLLGDRPTANVTIHVFVHAFGMLIGRLDFRMPFYPPKFVE